MEKISYLGPDGSYSSLAARKLAPEAELLPYNSFPAVFAALERGEADGAAVPIENSLNGGVLQNMDLLQSADAYAERELCVNIDHRLFTLKGATASEIEEIYSHSQALEQCSEYLVKNFPSARLIPSPSTAQALSAVTKKNRACIAGAHVRAEGLCKTAFNIADEPNNFTNFLLIRRGEVPEGKASQKIYFSAVCPNRSGALLSLLQLIAMHGLNMLKIESRPVKGVLDEYRFFLEIEGDFADEKIQAALESLAKNGKNFKLLGAY